MNVARGNPRWNPCSTKPMFDSLEQEILNDGDEVESGDDADCLEQSQKPELTDIDLEPYTVREVVRLTGLPRHRIYRMIHDLEIDAHIAPTGPRAWLIPSYEVRRLMLIDPNE